MNSRFGLYCIIDPYAQLQVEEQVLAMTAGGAKIIQYRDKDVSDVDFLAKAWKIREVTREKGMIFIINDRVSVAREIDADGVHLGQDDISIADARKILGMNAIIGRSTHSLGQAIRAEQEAASYISCGPIFETATKPEYAPIGLKVLKQVVQKVSVPVVAIGGIHEANLSEVLETGVKNVAMIRAITQSDDIESKVRTMSGLIDDFYKR